MILAETAMSHFPDWIWALFGSTIVGAASFWCKAIYARISEIGTSIEKISVQLGIVEESLKGHTTRIERLEGFVDNCVERMAACSEMNPKKDKR